MNKRITFLIKNPKRYKTLYTYNIRRSYLRSHIRLLKYIKGKCMLCKTSNYKVLEIYFKSGKKLFQGSSGKVLKRIIKGKLSSKDLQIICKNCKAKKIYEILNGNLFTQNSINRFQTKLAKIKEGNQ